MIKIQRKVTFAELGEEYGDSYLIINEPSIDETMSIADSDIQVMRNYLKDNLVEGRVFNGDHQEEVTKENIGSLPISFFSHAIGFLVGRNSQK